VTPLRRRFSNRVSAKEGPRRGELVASRPRATVSEDPSTVVASNEAGSATFHIADLGTGADETAPLTVAAAVIAFVRGSADYSNKSDEGDEEGLHVGDVWFA